MSGFLSTLREEFKNPDFRHSYVAENVGRGLAYQITALREDNDWSKAEFARRAGKPDSNVHRWEDPTYGKFSLSTLVNIASVFDVALIVRFASFEELLESTADLRPSKLAVPNYKKEQELLADQSERMLSGSAAAAFLHPPEHSGSLGGGALTSGKTGYSGTQTLPHIPEKPKNGTVLTSALNLMSAQ
jgi:transcriptional regulator with XRE-family HTH domain